MAPLTRGWRFYLKIPLTPLGIIALTILGIILLLALALVLGGCAFAYDRDGIKFRSAVGCVNITGPGFTIACPEEPKAPPIPNTPQPTPE